MAQKELYNKYVSSMYGICMRYTNDPSEVKDILQEGFLKVYLKIKQYSGKGSFEGWIKRIMINTAITQYNKKKNKRHLDIANVKETLINKEFIDDNINSDDDIDKDEIDEEIINVDVIKKADFSVDELLSVLNILPAGFRMVFNLYVMENYKHKEIAKKLKINEKTSRTRLLRARKIIQKELYKLSIEKVSK